MHIQSTFKLWFVSFSGGACIGADYSVRSCLITVGITEGRWEVREDCDEEKENGHNEEGGGGALKLILFKFVWCNLK